MMQRASFSMMLLMVHDPDGAEVRAAYGVEVKRRYIGVFGEKDGWKAS